MIKAWIAEADIWDSNPRFVSYKFLGEIKGDRKTTLRNFGKDSMRHNFNECIL